MTSRMRRISECLAGFALGVGLAFPQAPGAPQDPNLVTLQVSVLDKGGKPVSDLPQSAFTVYEDKIEQPLKIFKREDVPASLGILLDNSGSMRHKRTQAAASALALVKASNPDDEEFVVGFNDDVWIAQRFTTDIKKLEGAFQSIDSRGGTAMRDAISSSLDYLKADARMEKKVLVVITDGDDNRSVRTSLDQLVRKVQASGVLIYSIGLMNEEKSSDFKNAKKALRALAEASGGFDSYWPRNLAEAETIAPRIAHEIRNQYILAYTPSNLTMDGKFRSIRVEVKGYGKVRAKNGYYAKAASAKP
jgi:Ca-activated chloride channel family protein